MITSPEGDNSRCLLIDWDHSSGPTTYTTSLLDYGTTDEDDAMSTSDNVGAGQSTRKAAPLPTSDSAKKLTTRTVGYISNSKSASPFTQSHPCQGTPAYIARAVSGGHLLKAMSTRSFQHMPELQGNAKGRYMQTYDQVLYDSFSDRDGLYHGGVVSDDPQEVFLHRPRHDIESVFWTLLSSILRVSPTGCTPQENTNPEFSAVIHTLDSHVIGRCRLDSRELILDWREESLQAALHPKLASLAPMLVAMGTQIRPEYGYLSPSPRTEHLHEAMRRLLLQQIVDMGSDAIELDPHLVRVPFDPGGLAWDPPRVVKRMLETVDIFGTGQEPPGNKKVRKGTCVLLSSPLPLTICSRITRRYI
jgi:hypothetical protein